MGRLLGFVGGTAGAYLGWWLGQGVGVMTAFVLSMVGSGAGLYVGRRLAARYEP